MLPLDRKRIAEPYVVDGRNFLVDLDGPVSLFGRTWVAHQDVDEPRGFQSCNCIASSTMFWFLEDCIAIYDVATRQIVPIYTHVIRTEFWPWSTASVGGVQYFANKEVGLISRNPATGVWTIVSGANIPPVVYGCCESYGRLVVLGSENDGSAARACWSAIDDGSNAGFAPSLATGAGFQALSIIAGRLIPFRPEPFPDGFLAYTNRGIAKFESVQAANPFRFRVLTRSEVPLNPWVISRIGGKPRDQHVFLTHRGLYTTFGDEKPVIWQELTSEAFHRNILPNIDHANNEFTTRMDYNEDNGWLMISVSQDSRPVIYSSAYVFYEASGELGSFNKAHTGFAQIYLNDGPFKGYHFGMCDVNGSVWRFSFTDADRGYPVLPFFGVDYKLPYDLPAIRMASGPSLMSDWIIVHDDDLSNIDNAGVYDTRYEFEEFVSPATPVPPTEANTTGPNVMVDNIGLQASALRIIVLPLSMTETPLEASILVGPIMVDPTRIDQITQIQEAIISMLDSGFGDEIEDYINDYIGNEVIEDWNTLTALEDWGESAGNNTEYSVRFIGTLDGYNVWTTNGRSQSAVPALVKQTGRNKHLAEIVSGVYMFIEITANNIGETFHLKVLRVNVTDAGHLH